MLGINTIRSIMTAFSDRIAMMRRMSEFTCGDCNRWHRCGLRPDAACVVRGEQVARGEWRARRQAKALLHSVTWV